MGKICRLAWVFCLGMSALPALALDVRPTGFSADQSEKIQNAYREAYRLTLSCGALKDRYPAIYAQMIESFEKRTIRVRSEPSKSDEYECAWSRPSWITPSRSMVIHPIAFKSNVCEPGNLTNVIFHEMVHMNWTFAANGVELGWGSEKAVQELTRLCAPDLGSEPVASRSGAGF